MHLTEKIRIFPSPQQEEVLWYLSKTCRLLYNFALAERMRSWELNNLRYTLQVFPFGKPEYISYIDQQNELPKLKEKYCRYSHVYSKVLQMVLRMLDADFRSFFSLRGNGDKNAMPPKFKGNKYFTTMIYNQSGFKIEDGKIILSQSYRKDVPLVFSIPEGYKFDKVYQVSVFQDGKNYYLSIVYECTEKQYVDNGLYQAIDIGVTKTVTAVNSQGKFFEVNNPRPDKYWNPVCDSLQSTRDHCKKESNRWELLNSNIKKCKKKCSNQIKDIQHKQTRKMVDNTKANTIIVGKLNVKEMAQSYQANNGLNRSTQNNGYMSRFIGFLTYKAELAGKKVIEIDERKTSKTCYVCGKQHDMPLYNRIMKCDCGNVIDRDRNSAVNIMIRFLLQNAMWTGYQQFVDNLRNTGLRDPLGVHSQEAPSVRMR